MDNVTMVLMNDVTVVVMLVMMIVNIENVMMM